MGKWAKYVKRHKREWEDEPQFKGWLGSKQDGTSFCKLCHSDLRPHRADLLRHSKTSKHKVQASKVGNMHQISLKTYAEGITNESFNLLDSETVKMLIPKLGPRLIFWKNYSSQAHKNKNVSETIMALEESIGSTDTYASSSMYTYVPDEELTQSLEASLNANKLINETDPVMSPLDDNASFLFENMMASHSSTSTPKRTYDTAFPESSSIPKVDESKKSNNTEISSVFPQGLEATLKKYVDGQIVLANKQKLSNDIRQKLVKVIMTELFSIYGLDIKPEVFVRVAREIECYFNNERADTYYVPYIPISTSNLKEKKKIRGCAPKGKLYTKYINTKTSLRLANTMKEQAESKTISPPKKSPTEDSNLDFLKVAVEPYQKVVEAWEDTFKIRRQMYVNASLQTMFQELPRLRMNFGIDLIEGDYNRRNPDKVGVIYSTWPSVAAAILAEATERKICMPETSDDSIQALLTLPYLFNPVIIKKSRKGLNWRPSKSEVQESFFLHVQEVSEVNAKIISRRAKLEEFGLTLQPFGLFVGNLESPTYVVVVEDTKYFLKSSIRALELLYKFYHACDVEYPFESEHIWLFLSELVFKQKPLKSCPAATTMVSDLMFYLNKA